MLLLLVWVFLVAKLDATLSRPLSKIPARTGATSLLYDLESKENVRVCDSLVVLVVHVSRSKSVLAIAQAPLEQGANHRRIECLGGPVLQN